MSNTPVIPFTTTTTREAGKDVMVRDYQNGETLVRVNGNMVGRLRADGSAWVSHRDLNHEEEFWGLDRTAFLGFVRLVHVY